MLGGSDPQVLQFLSILNGSFLVPDVLWNPGARRPLTLVKYIRWKFVPNPRGCDFLNKCLIDKVEVVDIHLSVYVNVSGYVYEMPKEYSGFISISCQAIGCAYWGIVGVFACNLLKTVSSDWMYHFRYFHLSPWSFSIWRKTVIVANPASIIRSVGIIEVVLAYMISCSMGNAP